MTTNPESIANTDFERQVLERLENLKRSDDELRAQIGSLNERVTFLGQEVGQFNEKFSNYQQSIQWVVQLASTLIASATVTVIVTSVVKS